MNKQELINRIINDLEENLHDSMPFIWKLARQGLATWTKKQLNNVANPTETKEQSL